RLPPVILVVNKIDLVGYSEDVFNRIATDFALLSRSLGVRDTHCIPVSATEGDNVVVRSGRTPWYDGPTVLGYLEHVDDTPLAVGSELRFPIQQGVPPQHAQLPPRAAAPPPAAFSRARGRPPAGVRLGFAVSDPARGAPAARAAPAVGGIGPLGRRR